MSLVQVTSLILAILSAPSLAVPPAYWPERTPYTGPLAPIIHGTNHFNISNFYCSGAPHAMQNYIEFEVTDGTFQATCSNIEELDPNRIELEFSNGPRSCDGGQTFFIFDHINWRPWSYILTVIHEVSDCVNRTAQYVFPDETKVVIKDMLDPGADYWRLNAPSFFQAEFEEESTCPFESKVQ